MVSEYLRARRAKRDAEARRFADMPDLEAAIRNAAGGRNKDGKCHSHQRRVGFRRLAAFERAIQRRRDDVAVCRSFGDLYDLLYGLRTTRIGSLTAYDTAVRIGSFLGLTPEAVYLHAGTREGARALGLAHTSDTLDLRVLPPELRRLRADEVEDFLCIYKRRLRSVRRSHW